MGSTFRSEEDIKFETATREWDSGPNDGFKPRTIHYILYVLTTHYEYSLLKKRACNESLDLKSKVMFTVSTGKKRHNPSFWPK